MGGIVRFFIDVVIPGCMGRRYLWWSRGDRSRVFALLPIPSFQLRVSDVMEITSDVTKSPVEGIRGDTPTAYRCRDYEYRAHQLQQSAPTCNITLTSRSRG